jgi:23S rRNA pseudouridine1911/1915/1917 synthase
VRVEGEVVTDPAHALPAGAEVVLSMNAPRNQPRAAIEIIYADTHVVVVDKPPGVMTVPFEETDRGTLDQLVREALKRRERSLRPLPPLGVVQRLDKNTSGVLVFARTLTAKRHLQHQFRLHSVHRRYVALAYGAVASATFRSRLVKDRGDGLRGSTSHPTLGRLAVTHVRTLERLGPATLIECRLETGRTHQIRIHLSEAGHPLVGESVYVRSEVATAIAAPRIMLHAAELGFEHPTTGRPLRFEVPTPGDMATVVQRLRKSP